MADVVGARWKEAMAMRDALDVDEMLVFGS